MNKEAANSCLKMFEDSPSFNHFILLVENSDLLLPTIVSRSVVLGVNPLRDVVKYFPDINPITDKLISGCVGLIDEYKDIDIIKIYESAYKFINNFEKLNYADIILWCNAHEEYDFSLMVNILNTASIDLIREGKSVRNAKLFLRSCKNMKDKMKLNLSLKMHFKFSILENRFLLE